jgi:2-oxoglutarate dehydrogenase E1 component
LGEIKRTGISIDDLKTVGEKISTIPEFFTLNPTIKKIYEQRKKSIETGEGIDFGTAEGLAYGSLLA